jgi:ABC-type Fe3+/spermidine/putrescine transport system ATPase subunit
MIGETGAPLLQLRGVSKSFGSVVAVEPLDLTIRSGDFYAILGPSGCGKTTLLRMIGGFTLPTSGRVEIDGQDVTRLNPERRPTNMVFQGYGLFPHMTVRQNIAYGLRVARRPAAEVELLVKDIMALVRLEALADRMPEALSGGQAQRVALCRALVMQPRVLLLDEPLGALDLKLRKAMQEELRRIHRSIGGTFLFVTHDQGEALALANRIAVMDHGRIVQEGDARDIYLRPKTRFVADFIGANLLQVQRRGGELLLPGGARVLHRGADGVVTLMIRPESVRLLAHDARPDAVVAGTVADYVFLGSRVRYRISVSDGTNLTAEGPVDVAVSPSPIGEAVRVGWSMVDQRVLDES